MRVPPAGSDTSHSIWVDASPVTDYPSLDRDLEADVAIVGGGITGITAAYLLARKGVPCVLIDKGRIAQSESGHTTGHVVDVADVDFRDLVRDHGEEAARENTVALRTAIRQIENLVGDLKIECGLHPVNAYLYAENEDGRAGLQGQLGALEKAGVDFAWVDRIPLPFPTHGGVRFGDQRALHVREYLVGLATAAVAAGARLFENSRVRALRGVNGDRTLVCAEQGKVRARVVLLATHVPVNDKAVWPNLRVTRTYAIAARMDRPTVPDALYWDREHPYHYTRRLDTWKGSFLIVGGEDRAVGSEDNDMQRYLALEAYARERFGIEDVTHRWSGQINDSADGLPLIGRSEENRDVWFATGYAGAGLTYGTLAAMILSDGARGGQSRFERLFDPRRDTLTPPGGAPSGGNGKQAPRKCAPTARIDEVWDGEGRIVTLEGVRSAVSNVGGKLRALDPRCTHMGCEVVWNDAEKSWDCPCHGSRFTIDGDVLNGPATEPLASKMSPVDAS